jgi:hypothetical protein
MRGTLTALFNIFLILILPILAWGTFLDVFYPKFGTPILGRIIFATLLLLPLVGIYIKTVEWPIFLRIVLGLSCLLILLFVFILFAFAAALTGATVMP